MALKRPVFFREYAENGIMDEGANHAGTSNLN